MFQIQLIDAHQYLWMKDLAKRAKNITDKEHDRRQELALAYKRLEYAIMKIAPNAIIIITGTSQNQIKQFDQQMIHTRLLSTNDYQLSVSYSPDCLIMKLVTFTAYKTSACTVQLNNAHQTLSSCKQQSIASYSTAEKKGHNRDRYILDIKSSKKQTLYQIELTEENLPFWILRKLGNIHRMYEVLMQNRCYEVVPATGIIRFHLHDQMPGPYILVLKKQSSTTTNILQTDSAVKQNDLNAVNNDVDKEHNPQHIKQNNRTRNNSQIGNKMSTESRQGHGQLDVIDEEREIELSIEQSQLQQQHQQQQVSQQQNMVLDKQDDGINNNDDKIKEQGQSRVNNGAKQQKSCVELNMLNQIENDKFQQINQIQSLMSSTQMGMTNNQPNDTHVSTDLDMGMGEHIRAGPTVCTRPTHFRIRYKYDNIRQVTDTDKNMWTQKIKSTQKDVCKTQQLYVPYKYEHKNREKNKHALSKSDTSLNTNAYKPASYLPASKQDRGAKRLLRSSMHTSQTQKNKIQLLKYNNSTHKTKNSASKQKQAETVKQVDHKQKQIQPTVQLKKSQENPEIPKTLIIKGEKQTDMQTKMVSMQQTILQMKQTMDNQQQLIKRLYDNFLIVCTENKLNFSNINLMDIQHASNDMNNLSRTQNVNIDNGNNKQEINLNSTKKPCTKSKSKNMVRSVNTSTHQWRINYQSRNIQDFLIQGLKVTLNTKRQSRNAWSYLYLQNQIPFTQTYRLKIYIHRCLQKNIAFGISNQRYCQNSTNWNEKDCYQYVGFSSGVFQNGKMKTTSGSGIWQDVSITMQVNLSQGRIQWISDKGKQAECISHKIKNNKIVYVPFVRMKDSNDCIQFQGTP